MTDKNYYPENYENQFGTNSEINENREEKEKLSNIEPEGFSDNQESFENPYAPYINSEKTTDTSSQDRNAYTNSDGNDVQQQSYTPPYQFLFPDDSMTPNGTNQAQQNGGQNQYMQNADGMPNYNESMPGAQGFPQDGFNYEAAQNGENNKKKNKEKKSLSRTAACVLVAACIVLSGICGVGGAVFVRSLERNSGSGSLVINKVEREEGEDKSDKNTADLSFAQISDKAADSVVEIMTESVVTGSFMQQYIASGAGSGVIISSDGYIISNNHVISGATNIKVTLRNGESYDAVLVGTDETLDVSLLKIDATNLKTAVFGDSEELRVGDTAIAIGNPLGQLGGTVTTGIISALDRDIDIDGVTMNLLQTNAAINPGNSGGGLFNGQGELIGLVVAKSSGEAVEGLGFAIPINDVTEILGDLKEYGYVRGRIYLGMSLIDIPNEQTAAMYGLKTPGVYVNAVDANSAAYSAGIQAADRIASVDGKKVSSSDEIEDILDKHQVGDTVKFEIERTSRLGKTTTGTVNVVLEEYTPSLSDRVQNNNNNSGMQDFSDIFGDIFGGIFN